MEKYKLAGTNLEKDNLINENLVFNDDKQDPQSEKQKVMMDKKLTKLWEKAEMAGFSGM